MTTREAALYQVGVALGTSHGLQQAARNLGEIAQQVRVWPASTQNVEWLKQLAANLGKEPAEERAGKRAGRRNVHRTVEAILEFATKLAADQNELADWLVAAQTGLEHVAIERKGEYAALLAGIQPDVTRPMGGPAKARPRAKTIGRRVLGRIAEGLKELADEEP